MSVAMKQNPADYKVADMSLADWGRKEIEMAEKEMPGSEEKLQSPDVCTNPYSEKDLKSRKPLFCRASPREEP